MFSFGLITSLITTTMCSCYLMIIDKTSEYSVVSLNIQYFLGAPSFIAVELAFLPSVPTIHV